MTKTFLFFCLFTFTAYAQQIACVRVSEMPLEADSFVGVDDFNHIYYTTGNVLYKKGQDVIRYVNFQLGSIGDIDILNPLEITVFYPDFNTVIKLDNTLNEIIKIDFNLIKNFRNLRYATTANDKSLWIFNTDLQQLEIFNYQTQELIAVNQPLNLEVMDQESNYNFCWLLTPASILKYNIYGSLLAAVPIEGYESFSQSGDHIILKKGNALFYKEDGSEQLLPLKISEIHIKDFYINARNLYIYDGKKLYHYQLNVP